MGNSLNVENRRLYLGSFRKKGKTYRGVLIFISLGILIMVLYIIITNCLFEEFRKGNAFYINIIMGVILIVTVVLTVFDCSRTVYYENGVLYSRNIFSRKMVKLESNMTVLLAPITYIYERKIVVKNNDRIVFKCSIGCFPDDKPVLIEDVQILKAICEKYDMEFINHWPEVAY